MTVGDLFRGVAATDPDATALVFRGRALSYGDLDDRVDLTAAALAGLGVGPGDRVALLAGNIPEYVTTFYGVARSGGVVCPLNVQLSPEELGYILADAGAKVAVTELQTLPGVLAVKDRLAELETVLVIGGPPAPKGTLSLEEALRSAGDPPDVRPDPDDLAVIAYTSGTTASPKGAMLTHRNLLSNLDQMGSVSELSSRASDVVLLVLPLFHSYALAAMGLALRSGASILLVERFHPVESLQLILHHGVTVVVGAPPMYRAWLQAVEEGAQAHLSSVRLAGSGASALPPEVLAAFRDRFGLTIWEGYGLTEAAPAVTSSAVGSQVKPGSIGPPLPGIEVRLVDEHGEDVEEGDPGEVWVRGPNVFGGYWNRPDATAEVLTEGWLRTGDVAVRDEDGYLYLVDRKKDLIIVSGFNVYPREVEEAIARHPKVAEAAVVGIPDDRTGEAVQAWVVPVPGQTVDPGELLEFLHGYLARFKWPKDVRVVEELPRHVTGKVLRRALRGEELLRDEDAEP